MVQAGPAASSVGCGNDVGRGSAGCAPAGDRRRDIRAPVGLPDGGGMRTVTPDIPSPRVRPGPLAPHENRWSSSIREESPARGYHRSRRSGALYGPEPGTWHIPSPEPESCRVKFGGLIRRRFRLKSDHGRMSMPDRNRERPASLCSQWSLSLQYRAPNGGRRCRSVPTTLRKQRSTPSVDRRKNSQNSFRVFWILQV